MNSLEESLVVVVVVLVAVRFAIVLSIPRLTVQLLKEISPNLLVVLIVILVEFDFHIPPIEHDPMEQFLYRRFPLQSDFLSLHF